MSEKSAMEKDHDQKQLITGLVLIAIISGWVLWGAYSEIKGWFTPAPPAASATLYSRADLQLTTENQTFADEIIQGLTIVRAEVEACRDLDPRNVQVSGTRATETGYVFWISCENGARNIWFNSHKIVHQ